MRTRLKRHDEDDWQRQLHAEPSLVLVSEEERAQQLRQQLAGRRLRRSLDTLAVVLLGAAGFFLTADGHGIFGRNLVVLIPVVVILGGANVFVSSRWAKRQRLERGDQPLDVAIRRLLYSLEQDCKGFRADPPQRRAYADWLASGTERLQKLSPDIAMDWAKPDPTDRVTGLNVSTPELEARARRIDDLRRTVIDAWNPHADSLRNRVQRQVRALEAGRRVRRG